MDGLAGGRKGWRTTDRAVRRFLVALSAAAAGPLLVASPAEDRKRAQAGLDELDRVYAEYQARRKAARAVGGAG